MTNNLNNDNFDINNSFVNNTPTESVGDLSLKDRLNSLKKLQFKQDFKFLEAENEFLQKEIANSQYYLYNNENNNFSIDNFGQGIGNLDISINQTKQPILESTNLESNNIVNIDLNEKSEIVQKNREINLDESNNDEKKLEKITNSKENKEVYSLKNNKKKEIVKAKEKNNIVPFSRSGLVKKVNSANTELMGFIAKSNSNFE